jgi:ribosome-associated protein
MWGGCRAGFIPPLSVGIFVQKTRSQARNRKIARERLAELVLKATVLPKWRRLTRPTKGSVVWRLKAKKVQGEVRKGRGRLERQK